MRLLIIKNIKMKKRNKLVKVFIYLGRFGIPFAVAILFYFSSKKISQIFFLIFMIAHCVERVWETFYTTKEHRSDEFHGDWTLAWATIAYIVMCFAVTFEFYFTVRTLNVYTTAIGLLFYSFSIFMRWAGMKALGQQWAIHAIGVQKISKVRLIKIGVYKYVRHPIYLGIIFEVISIPIISNAFYSLAFVALINVPIQIVRMKLEEKNNIRKLGEKYKNYMREVNALIPIKYLRKKICSNVPS